MDRLLKLLKKVKPEVDFEHSDNFVSKGILDSIDLVAVISEIEAEYGIEIDPNDVEPEYFQSLATMLKLIEKNTKA